MFDNPLLRDIDGFANLRAVGEHLYIMVAYQGMDALFDLPYPSEPDKTWGGWG